VSENGSDQITLRARLLMNVVERQGGKKEGVCGLKGATSSKGKITLMKRSPLVWNNRREVEKDSLVRGTYNVNPSPHAGISLIKRKRNYNAHKPNESSREGPEEMDSTSGSLGFESTEGEQKTIRKSVTPENEDLLGEEEKDLKRELKSLKEKGLGRESFSGFP